VRISVMRWLSGPVLSALLLQAGPASAQFPGIPNLPNLPGMPRIPALPQVPGGASTSGDAAAVLGVCALVGAAGASVGKKMAESEARRLKLSSSQRRQREQNYMLGWGLFGCTIGGGAASTVMKNMSESARKAQDDAWKQAQAQTGPVTWSDPNSTTRGTTEITERERLPDGGECGTRRDVIEAEEGTAEPMLRVCRTANSPEWRPVVG